MRALLVFLAGGIVWITPDLLLPVRTKWTGAFEGEIINPLNVLVITEQRDSVVKGKVFINHYEHYPFHGITKANRIKGVIILPPDREESIILIGELLKDSLHITLTTSSDSILYAKSRLKKVSASANYDVQKTFGKPRQQFDEQLIGKWCLMYDVSADGQRKQNNLGICKEYMGNGSFLISSGMMEAIYNKYPEARTGSWSKNTWFTVNNRLIETTQIIVSEKAKETAIKFGLPIPDEQLKEFIFNYEIKRDTLITTTAKWKSFYIRKGR